jgi:LPXTG-site transpeptidase (sortase) family protein
MNTGVRSHTTSIRLLVAFVGLSISAAAYAVDGGISPWYSLPNPDQSDWSAKRVSYYQKLDATGLGEPIATLNVPDLGVAAHIYADSHSSALEAGAAWVNGTTIPGSSGNIAIAGHRDSFFRPLEGIPFGTEIQLTTSEGIQSFEVVQVDIVDALDIRPLEATDTTVLTLITCHPFRYRGYAPDRYIVRAKLIEQISIAGRSGQIVPAAHIGQPQVRE